MARITYAVEPNPEPTRGEYPVGVFYKDGVKFATIGNQLLTIDEDDVAKELYIALKFELNDPSLNDELLTLMKETFPAVIFND